MKIWFKYIKPYLPAFILGPLCMVIEVIGEVVMPKLLSYIIDFGVNNKTENVPDIVRWIYSVFGNGNALVITLTVGMILTAILMMIGGVGGAWFGAYASINFASDLRSDMYRKVQKFSFANIDKFQTGSIVTRLTNDVAQILNFINMLLRMALRAPGMMIGAIIMAIILNPSLTTVLLVTLPLMGVAIGFVIYNGLPRFSKMQSRIDELNTVVQENITNVRVVKSFVREKEEINKFSVANGNLKKSGYDAMNILILISPIMNFFMYATIIAVYWFGGNMVINSNMTAGELTAYITYITQILQSLLMVSFMLIMMSRALASGKRIKELLLEEPDIIDNNENSNLLVSRGEVEFNNVTFRYYKNSEEKVLDNVSLKIDAGKTIGIIGSTGCGKSTLVSMIARLYDPDEGEILVDGINVKEYSLKNLRDGVSMVLQKNVLFSGSVKDNLKWGNENASEEEIIEACADAQADKFILSLPNEYDYSIDQGGTNVSGGQKQRLCIARALLKKPKILVLDDSTSAVDTATESMIKDSLYKKIPNCTKIIIAQRISSVINADQIIVMDNGKITGVGNHQELLENNNEYQEIYYSQIEKENK